jgi:hypothetical protein
MLYNLSFLLLWRPLLLDLLVKGSSSGKVNVSSDDVQFALACVKLADTCRIRSEELFQNRRINAFSWMVAYTSFLSEAYVLALLSIEGLASQLGDGWLPALGGIRILAVSACGDSCATHALQILKVCPSFAPGA